MGSGKGKDYGNTKNKVSKFAENLANLIEDYVLDGLGFFGEKANDTVRRIFSSDPLATMQDFVKKATEGAEIKELSNGKGYIAKFSDGFQIIYREKSSSDGSPALEIWTNIKRSNFYGYRKNFFNRRRRKHFKRICRKKNVACNFSG